MMKDEGKRFDLSAKALICFENEETDPIVSESSSWQRWAIYDYRSPILPKNCLINPRRILLLGYDITAK